MKPMPIIVPDSPTWEATRAIGERGCSKHETLKTTSLVCFCSNREESPHFTKIGVSFVWHSKATTPASRIEDVGVVASCAVLISIRTKKTGRQRRPLGHPTMLTPKA